MTKNVLKLEVHELNRFDSLDSAIDTYTPPEVTPKVEHYLKTFDFNHKKRPTLQQLHQNSVNSNIIPTFMNLLGGTLYLRMGIMAGQAGIMLSLSALCTNGDIGCGGFYYLISRNLGPEIGAVFGLIYFITNAVLVSQNISGICSEIQYILQVFNTGIVEYPSGINDQRIVGLICLVIIAVIPFISLDLEAKTQWILFFITMLSLLDFFVGTFLPTTPYQKVNGFIGFNAKISFTNLLPQWNGYHFLSIFGIYMSALCGDFTGVTMSSSLKNPKVAIPKGSLLAVFTSQIIYTIQIILFACAGNRYATGNLTDYQYGNYTCDIQENCESGISNNEFMMSIMSALTLIGDRMHYIEPIYASGLLAQALSSSLSSFITAPRILQSLGFDNLLPGISWFSKPYGPHADPRRGYVQSPLSVTYCRGLSLISVVFIVITCGQSVGGRPSNTITNGSVCLTVSSVLSLCLPFPGTSHLHF
ncbi:bumetanide-sensitive sodium-(potassium)-chloride cotransporter-like [Oppia nitens]|uniref:bumetanide-sensitive sodium-(potassium)-chloride cotransporter-like n=1 Tax=Oppia nitens TaxID=1686743 RepID=UPI0023DC61CF|nr:bumetanide-sensitive sodium-(potassium)-chloride cotransporter-like [Oppia nitens]